MTTELCSGVDCLFPLARLSMPKGPGALKAGGWVHTEEGFALPRHCPFSLRLRAVKWLQDQRPPSETAGSRRGMMATRQTRDRPGS